METYYPWMNIQWELPFDYGMIFYESQLALERESDYRFGESMGNSFQELVGQEGPIWHQMKLPFPRWIGAYYS